MSRQVGKRNFIVCLFKNVVVVALAGQGVFPAKEGNELIDAGMKRIRFFLRQKVGSGLRQDAVYAGYVRQVFEFT